MYEKLGVRFEDFLLDEFQDTSMIQWENFLPLLKNSVAGGFDNLVVGDVKQSIYRWRGSDWHLLDAGVQAEFHLGPQAEKVLDGNYRTCRAIVAFNNAFFPYAAVRRRSWTVSWAETMSAASTTTLRSRYASRTRPRVPSMCAS